MVNWDVPVREVKRWRKYAEEPGFIPIHQYPSNVAFFDREIGAMLRFGVEGTTVEYRLVRKA